MTDFDWRTVNLYSFSMQPFSKFERLLDPLDPVLPEEPLITFDVPPLLEVVPPLDEEESLKGLSRIELIEKLMGNSDAPIE